MIDLGKGVSVDFKDHPYVFSIEGWDPIRIQKGEGRITGVSLEQLKLIIKAIEGSKDGQKSNNANVVKTSTRKVGADGVRGSKPRANDGHSSE